MKEATVVPRCQMKRPVPSPADLHEDVTWVECGQPATCYGAYKGDKKPCYSCDACCGHGNEDGQCKPIRRRPPAPGAAGMRITTPCPECGSTNRRLETPSFDNRSAECNTYIVCGDCGSKVGPFKV